ncbi:hypothetical protein BDW74DRAFT_153176 [Aspergillus multicolor]|uniref:5'-methylthioadenosine/S-adenosylhomocysteine nucleosidase family protein n=1 Tax=Aspergillus multicolor TaxID=41759 RepID=UPI003CCDF83B
MATKTSAAPKDAKFTVGLICALPLEAAAVCAMLDKPYDAPARSGNDNNAYDLGKIHEHNVVIASLPAGCMGNDTAAIVANDMVRTYGETLRVCLLIGVAGGIVENEDVRLGDVVVGFPREKSSGVIQYDFGKHEDDEIRLTGHLNKPPPIILSALSKLIRHHLNNEPNFPVYLRNAIQKNNSTRRHFAYPGLNADRLFKAECIHPLKEKTCNNCPEDWEEDRKPRESQDPVVHYGTIASGNAVIKNSSARKRLSEKAEGALCLEMEAAGLSKAFPCLVIRGICDYADSHKNKQWRGYAAMAAAAFAKEFLSHLPAEEVSSQPTVQEIWSELLPPLYAK